MAATAPGAESAETSSSKIPVSVCKLSEEGKYAFAGLAANILAELFSHPEEKYVCFKILNHFSFSFTESI